MKATAQEDAIPEDGYDVIVVGSGFGGMMAAEVLVRAGQRVLMLERGDWVPRGDHNAEWSRHWEDRAAYSLEAPYVAESGPTRELGAFHCVGGPSVFFGGVGLRLRERDFAGDPYVSGDVRWCIDYGALRSDYDRAEALLGLTGDDRADATAPPRTRPLPPPGKPLSQTSRAVFQAAERLGFHPFHLPIALNEDPSNGRARCTACGACDGFACATGAKNDLATAVLPELIRQGLVLRPNSVVAGLELSGAHVSAAVCLDRRTGIRRRFRAKRYVVAAGALATPHLLLASGMDAFNPAGSHVGRHLMRHCNGIVLGAAPPPLGEAADFRKQVGIHDLYFGDPDGAIPGKLGAIQQIRATRIALSMAPLPAGVRKALYPVVSRLVGFIVIAADQPRARNRVTIDRRTIDRYGRPTAHVHHHHTRRDLAARRALGDHAARVLNEMGAAFTFRVPVHTFSHALGTVRMGDDPELFPVAPDGRFRGIDNVWVTDGSVFPTSGAVNPSLTISANAMRIARGMVRAERPSHPRRYRTRRRAQGDAAGSTQHAGPDAAPAMETVDR